MVKEKVVETSRNQQRAMKKILVIEDERILRQSVVKILKNENFEIIEAKNGSMGVYLARTQKPDLILCDLIMPELDGYGVLGILQQDPNTVMIPFICLTAQEDRASLRQIMELGASDYITKPFTRSELLGAIATQLGKRERLRQQQNLALLEATAKLNRLAYYDSSTKLPNQLLLREEFTKIVQLNLYQSQVVPLMILCLNQFQRFTYGLGTKSSEKLLQVITERIIVCAGIHSLVARLNEEQFAILLPKLNARKKIEKIAQTLLEILSQPFDLEEKKIYISCSIGIGIFPLDGNKLDSLLQNTTAALAEAQQMSGNRYQFYRPSLKEQSSDRFQLEMDLRLAVEQGELLAYYQPQLDLKTGKIVAAEALMRWQRPDSSFVSPAKFIPLAEEIGLVIALDEWMLYAACNQAKIWQQQGLNLTVAVNLSGVHFNQSDLSRRVVRVLENTGLEPQYLELEVTETALVQNQERAIATLQELKALGIRLSLDDFGSGYSSLMYLQQFPFDSLKIDRSFIQNLTKESKNEAIVTATIQMAHSLNLQVVAEGVETQQEQAFLSQHQCDLIQGYAIGHPMPPLELQKMLQLNQQTNQAISLKKAANNLSSLN